MDRSTASVVGRALEPSTRIWYETAGAGAGDAVTVSTVLAVRYSSPLIGTDVSALTAAVERENAALVAPAGTVTLTGTVAALVFELKSSTTAPPAGAGLWSVTVPADELPPVTCGGLRATERIGGTGAAGGPTVSGRLFALAP